MEVEAVLNVEPRQAPDRVRPQRHRCPGCLLSLEAMAGPLRMETCPSCRTVSAWPLPTLEELAAYYNSDYSVVDAGLTPRARRAWVPLLEEAERRVRGRRGLELGSSNGAFLRLASERGWEMAGVELDGRARQQHRHRSPHIPAWETLAEAASAGATMLDAVWILHTVEHLPGPEETLRDVLAMLAPGGVLAVTTPNGACLQRRMLGPLWEWWSPPGHLALLSPAGARLMLERAGFEVLFLTTRRGDSAGAAANALLAPARWWKRRRSGNQQTSSARSPTRRIADLLNLGYDPVSLPLRLLAYRRLLGPELLVVARRPRSEV